MVKKLGSAVLFTLLLAACREEVKLPPPRETIDIRYVSVPELQVRQAPNATAPVVTTYKVGESVSIVAEKDGWSEVRVGSDGSGWVENASLSKEKEAGSTSEEVRFVKAPSPVFTASNVQGEILLEASVNTDGDVVNVRTVMNTTGNDALAAKNADELRKAKFYPMMVQGRAKPFIYVHRATY